MTNKRYGSVTSNRPSMKDNFNKNNLKVKRYIGD